MRDTTHVLWLDNYSKTYAAAVQGLVGGAYASCLWMARGLKKYVGEPVDLNAANIPRGVPNPLFTNTRMKFFKGIMANLDCNDWLYEDSYCTQFSIQTVPPKRVVSPLQDPALAKQMNEHRDGVTNFFPLDVIDSNPAKNTELVTYFREQHFDRKMRDPDGPVEVMVCDVNIYHRILKVRHHFGPKCVVRSRSEQLCGLG
jgi:hypothetical protein